MENTSRDATMKVFIPSLRYYLLAMHWKWIQLYISTELGANHDWFIAEYNPESEKHKLLRSGRDHHSDDGSETTDKLKEGIVDEECQGSDFEIS